MDLDKKGFTLLEVLIAVSILAIAVTVLIQIFSSNLKSLAYSEDHLNAVIKAEESLRALYLSNDTVEGVSITKTREGIIIRSEVVSVNTDRTKDIPLNMLEITVTTLWQKDKKERSVVLKSYKTVEKRPYP